MKTPIKIPIPSFFIALILALACGVGPLHKAGAVSPPPDGAYPDFTTAEGQHALQDLTTGAGNTALGAYSLFSTSTASFNTAVGAGALDINTGDANTAVGVAALLLNTGTENSAVGVDALGLNTAGSNNNAVGAFALYTNTAGSSNVAIGAHALFSNITGTGNIALGNFAGSNVTTADNVICIGTDVSGANTSDTCFISNIRNETTGNNDAIPVVIDSAGQLGTASSSRRYKTDIKPMDTASESILALKPVSFRYKVHKDTTPQFGLIAEDVAEVNPDLVVRDKNGEIYTVRYDAVNAMLLNEFLKEHRKVEQLTNAMAEQQKENASVRAILKEQAAQIQKVSAQLELNKPAPQTVANNR